MSCSKRRVIATKPGAATELVYLADDEQFPSSPPKGFVKVHTLATTCTYTDLLVISGNYPLNHPFPRSPGYDIVGRIDAIGEGTDIPAGLHVGSMVTILAQSGGCQEFLFWPAKDVQIVPRSWKDR
jgi:NADPH:quinone reductase-like Zn-dependent oxidoreductase